MMKKVFVCITFIFTLNTASAQSYFNISLLGGVPQLSFAQHTEDFHLGLGLDLNFKVHKYSPFYLGIGVNYNSMGSKYQLIEEELKVMSGTTVITTLPIKLGVNTTNALTNWVVKSRCVFPTDVVHPYVEVNGGLNYLNTRVKVTDETEKKIFTSENPDDNTISSKNASSDITYAFGGGAGLLIDAGSGCVELGVCYMWGGRADYFNKDQIKTWTVEFSGSSGTFDASDPKDISLSNENATLNTSFTDILYFHLGYTFKFNEPKKKAPVKKSSQQNHKPVPKKH